MQRFVIERQIPTIGQAGNQELRDAAVKSNDALAQIGKDIQWIESFVIEDRTFCVYLAESEEQIRKHAEISGFPANHIYPVKRIIDPTTAGTVARIRS
jgi:hypothetical protein